MGEAHYLNSGFGTYTKELLTRLHKTNKYILAEMASYGADNHVSNVPWLVYPNVPLESNTEETKVYNSNPVHQFGAWRFDKVCLDFKPDIVLCYRDPWMDNWISQTVLRRYFHWVWMPTVDSAPQRQEWIDTFAKCDALLAYSEFGGEILLEQGKDQVNYIGCASPGIDPSIYKPVPKKEHRKAMGIEPDCFIVGTVMRNQKRKLFFELMKAFRLFLDTAPSEIAAKTFLYLHTSYPEKQGWDIAEGIIQNKLGGKVLMTYVCKNCQQFFTSLFQDELGKCKSCNQMSTVCPTVSFGVSVEGLAKIYNLFDIYVQYAICEGFGMPQVEAAACGIPVAATDYSAMRDVVRATHGYPIPVQTFFREMETNAERAYPDNNALAQILLKFFAQSEADRVQQSVNVRNHTIKRYCWDDTVKVWEKYLDTYQPSELQGHWDASPLIHPIPASIPPNLSNEEFVHWLYHDLLHEPDKLHQSEGIGMYRTLNFGAEIGLGTLQPINKDQIFTKYKQHKENSNNLEHIRVGNIDLPKDQFIRDAHTRQKQYSNSNHQ